MVGGGVTGVVLGTTGSGSSNEVQVVGQTTSLDSHSNHSTSLEDPESGSSTELLDSGNVNHSGAEGSIAKSDQVIAQDVKEAVPTHQISGQPEMGEKGLKIETQAQGPKSLEEKDPASRENNVSRLEEQQQTVTPAKKVEKGSYPSPRQVNLKTRTPRQSLRRPRLEEQSFPKTEVVFPETQVVKKEDWSNKNWFLVRWNDGDEFDASSWSFDECSPKITGEKVVFVCPWNLDTEKMIELHLSISADEELTGKEWKKT